MTVPVYDTDLEDIDLCDVIGDWVEMPGHKSGGAPAQEGDFYIQGSACVSQSTGTATGTAAGMASDGYAPAVIKSNFCFFAWQVLLAGNGIYPFEQGGMSFWVGSALTDWYGWKTAGDNFGRNPYGGWGNAAVWPSYPYDYVEGSPVAETYAAVASLPNLRNAISKGNPHGVDVIRYGRGSLIASGGNLSDGHCTFAGMVAANDEQTARWGLLQEQAGTYLTKGVLSIGAGRDVTATPTSASFVDANRVITIDLTPRTYRTFNKVEINNSGSFVSWQNILMSAVSGGGLSRGILEVGDVLTGKYNGLQGVNIDTCTFTDMFEHIYRDNCFIADTTYRRCGTVYQNSAEIDGCVFSNSPSAISLLSNDIELITNCDFTSDGLNHAIELTENHIQGGSYNLTGLTYTGYAAVSGGTRNEAIYNNSGNLLTLNIIGGDLPSIRNGTGANTQLVLATTYTLSGLVSGSEVQIVTQDSLDDGAVNPDEDLWHEESVNTVDDPARNTYKSTYVYNYTADIPIYIYILKPGYEWLRVTDTLTNENKSVPVSQKIDRVESNP